MITSAAPGLWSVPATWTGGVVPSGSDVVKINHQVILDGSYSCAGIDSASAGTLVAQNSGIAPSSFKLVVGFPQAVYTARGVSF